MTSHVGVITCWLYRSVNRLVGHLCDFDVVVGIDMADDDDWMAPMSFIGLFHMHQLMIPTIYSLAKIHTLALVDLGSMNMTRDQ